MIKINYTCNFELRFPWETMCVCVLLCFGGIQAAALVLASCQVCRQDGILGLLQYNAARGQMPRI